MTFKSIDEVIKYIITTYSFDMLYKSKKCKALITDLAPNLKTESKKVFVAFDNDLVKILVDANSLSNRKRQVAYNKFVKMLVDEAFLKDEAANEIGMIFAKALDWNVVSAIDINSSDTAKKPTTGTTTSVNTSIKKALQTNQIPSHAAPIPNHTKSISSQRPVNAKLFAVICVCVVIFGFAIVSISPNNGQSLEKNREQEHNNSSISEYLTENDYVSEFDEDEYDAIGTTPYNGQSLEKNREQEHNNSSISEYLTENDYVSEFDQDNTSDQLDTIYDEDEYDAIETTPLLKTDDYINISQLNCSNQSSSDDAFVFYDTVVDNYGTSYSNGLGGTDGYGQSWKEYKLDGTYSELRGRVVLNYDVRTQTNDDVFLWIYGDDIALFMSNAVTAGCEPQDFVIDIKDVDTLKIVIQGQSMLRLVDCGLYKSSSVQSVTSASNTSSNVKERVYLSDIEWFNASRSDGGFLCYNAVKDNFGTTYANGIGGTDGYGQSFQEYKLDGTFGELRGKVVLNYDVRTQTNDDVFVWIYGNDELLFQSQAVTAGYEPQNFVIDLTGVNKLKIIIQGKSMLRLVDCGLYKDSSVSSINSANVAEQNSKDKIYLSNLDWFNGSSGGFLYYDAVKDNFGTTYANGIGGSDGYGQSFQEYRLDGAYSELKGRVVLNYDVRTQTNDDVFLWIYGDGALLYQSQVVTAGCDPQDFSINLADVKDLKVVIQGQSMLRLVDCILKK